MQYKSGEGSHHPRVRASSLALASTRGWVKPTTQGCRDATRRDATTFRGRIACDTMLLAIEMARVRTLGGPLGMHTHRMAWPGLQAGVIIAARAPSGREDEAIHLTNARSREVYTASFLLLFPPLLRTAQRIDARARIRVRTRVCVHARTCHDSRETYLPRVSRRARFF